MVIECSNTRVEMNHWRICEEKNLALNDCKATTLLPGPTLTAHLGQRQSQQPAQSCRLPLALLTPARCCPAARLACPRAARLLGTRAAPPPLPGRVERQKHSETPETNRGILETQSNSHQRMIYKKPVFAPAPCVPATGS